MERSGSRRAVSSGHRKSKHRARFGAMVEALEFRWLMSNDWIGPSSGGAWDTAGNWSALRVPNSSDDVTIPANTSINAAGADVAHTITSSPGDTLNVSNTLTLGAASSLFNLNLTGAVTIGGTLSLSGDASTWSAGTISGNGGNTVSNTGTLMLTGGLENLVNGATLSNHGVIIQTIGELRTNGSVISNSPGGVFDLQGGAAITTSGGAAGFNNTGLLTKSVGSADATMVVPFNNSGGGTVESNIGALVLNGGGSSTGANYSVASGATIDLVGGSTQTFAGNFTGSGTGEVVLQNGTILLGAGGATFNFPGGFFQWTGGAINGNGANSLTNAAGATVNINGSLENLVNAATLINHGTIVHSAGELRTNSSTITNATDGVYQLFGAAVITTSGGAEGFNNSGLLIKPSGTAAATVAVPYNSVPGATVESDAATLVLSTGGNSTGGTFVAGAGAVIDPTGGSSPVYSGTFTASGSGNLVLNSGTIVLGGDVAFNFPGAFFQWSGGAINGNGGHTLTNNATINIGVGGSLENLVNGTTLSNQGNIIETAGELRTNSSVINNTPGGVFDFQNPAGASITTSGGAAAFNNSGVLTKSSGAGNVAIAVPFNNDTAGQITITATTSPTLTLSDGGVNTSGNYFVAAGAVLDLTGGSTPTLTGNYTGSGAGTVLLASGTIVIGSPGALFNFPSGLFQWTGGTINGNGGNTLTNAGIFNINGSLENLVNGATLLDTGRIIHISGELRTNSSIISNTLGGIYDFQNAADASITTSGGAAAFNNIGTLLKSSGSGNVAIAVPFNNDAVGKVVISATTSPTMTFSAGGVDAGGNYTVAGGALVDLVEGASPSITGTYTGSGAGHVQLANGQLVLSNGGAVFNYPASFFQWVSGTINGNGGNSLTNASTGFMTLSGGLENLVNGATLLNSGTITQTTGELRTNSSLISNPISGHYFLDGGAAITTSGGASGFTNAGLLDKPTGSASTATVAVPYNGTTGGVIESDAGLLVLSDNGANSGGNFVAAAGATIDLTGGSSPSYSGVFNGSGAGTVLLGSGTLVVTGATDPNGATFNFAGNLFQWTGGTINGNGGLTFTNAGQMNLTGGLENLVNGATLFNTGTIVQTAGELRTNGSTITNASSGKYQFQNAITGASVTTSGGAAGFTNIGMLSEAGGSGVATITVPYNSTGITEVDAGTLTISGTLAQLTTPTLTAGTWNIINGTLDTTSPDIVTNNASITLGSASASWPSLGPTLFVNNGSLTLTNGANIATGGGFTSPGTLSLGATTSAAGKIAVSGLLSQTGTFVGQLGGVPGTGIFGSATASSVTIDGAVLVNRVPSFVPSPGTQYELINNTGPNPVSGTFVGLGEGTMFTTGFVDYTISYIGGDGNDIVVTAGAAHSNLKVSAADNGGGVHEQGSSATLALTLVNNGAAATNAATANIYLSPTPTFNSQTDVLIGVTNLPGVAFNDSTTITPTVNVPAFVPLGTYYITTIVNPGSSSQVFTTPSAIFTVGVAATINFSLDDIFPTTPLVVGSAASVTITASNSGNMSSSADVNVYLSQDSVAGNSDDILVGHLSAATLAATATNATLGSLTIQIPGNLPAGAYHLVGVIDPSNLVAETNESDNMLITSGTIAVTATTVALPDVSVRNVAVSDSSILPGSRITVTATAVNSGVVAAAALPVNVYLSRSSTFNPATDILLGSITIPALGAGASGNVIGTFSVAGAVPANDYFITTAVDPAHTAADANPADKTLTSAAPLVTVSHPAVKIGALNPSFGDSGIAKTTITGSPFMTVDSAIQSDGKIVVAGTQVGSGFVLLRFNADGSLDSSFGTGGVVRTTLSATDLATSIAIQKDGKILLAGRSNGNFAILRFTSDGALDSSFGNNGVVVTDLAPILGTGSSVDQINAIATRSDGKIFVTGITDARGTNDFAVARYNADGSLDTSYNHTGVATIDFAGGSDSANTLVIQKDGNVVVAGSATINGVVEIAAARLLNNGVLDPKFGNHGKVNFTSEGPDDEIFTVLQQTDGKIILGGFYSEGTKGAPPASTNFYIARLTTAGVLDKTFGTNGQVRTRVPNAGFASINQIALTKDGKLVVAGKTVSSLSDAGTGRFGVEIARYNTNGKLDTTFNGNGFLAVFQPSNAPGAPGDANSDLTSQFQAFTAASVGLVDLTPGGGILTLASDPTNAAASSTTVSVASVVPDGPNITPSLKLLATPASVLSGAQGKASLTITNTGTLPLKGSIPVTLYLSLDMIRSADDRGLPPIHVSVNLSPKQSKTFTVSFTFPKNLPNGKYFLLADVNASGAIAEINNTDDQVAVKSAVNVALAAANVGVKLANQPPGTIASGKNIPISLLLTNNGNIPATGNATIRLFASSDNVLDGTDVSLIPAKNVKVNLKPKASTKISMALVVKASALPPGMDFLVASVQFQGKTNSAFSNALIEFP